MNCFFYQKETGKAENTGVKLKEAASLDYVTINKDHRQLVRFPLSDSQYTVIYQNPAYRTNVGK
jgi:hypothetical protein